MIPFLGLRAYRTREPLLNQDLQRQNLAVAAAVAALDSGKQGWLVPREAPKDTDAAYGELVIATGTDVVVTLPKSSLAGAGRRVSVAYAGAGSVFVAANAAQRNADGSLDTVALLPAGTPYTMSTPGQALTFTDGGDGRWWRS